MNNGYLAALFDLPDRIVYIGSPLLPGLNKIWATAKPIEFYDEHIVDLRS